MVFSSLEFLFLFFPAALVLYYIIPRGKLKLRNFSLLVTSLVFYAWGEPVYVFLMIFSILIDYIYGYLVVKYKALGFMRKAKAALIASVCTNLAVLGFFKYYGFFISNLRRIPGLEQLPLIELALPIGISFYTFQTMSYTIDIYRSDAALQKNIVSFGTYVAFFPALIAGPIVRYKDIDHMLRERHENVALFASGVRTFLAGLGKKVFIANVAGEMWGAYLSVPADGRTVIGSWIGISCYALQIYFDFSGYSDMAIGLGKMFGFRFLENFNYPYIAKSVTDFWRRWHMSLSSWFRENVYFPLGGNRGSSLKTYRNLLLVWLLTGFWHGASWNFVLWGLYYFILLVLEKTFLLKWTEKLPNALRHVYLLVLVLFGWLLFVFEDFSAGTVYLQSMFGIGAKAFVSQADIYDFTRNILFFGAAALAATPLPKKYFYNRYEKSPPLRYAAMAGGILIFVCAVAYLVDSAFNPFLYFRF